MEIKIRQLTIADRKVVTGMIAKLADIIGKKGLTDIIISDSGASSESTGASTKENQFTQIGINILKQLIVVLDEDVSAWFAALIGVSVDAYQELPIDTDMIIVEQLMAAQEANSFFTKALQVFKTTQGFMAKFSNKKTV